MTTSNSSLVSSVQATIITIPEANENSLHNNLGKGLFITPSEVAGRTGDITGYILAAENKSGKVYWADNNSTLPSALISIGNLTTTGNEIIYTIASDTYATSNISPLGRSFISLSTTTSQRTQLGLEIGVDVQGYSTTLTDIINSTSNDDRIIYTNSGSFTTSLLTPFVRTDILTATSSSELSTTLGYIVGPVSTIDSLTKVSGSNTIVETGITINSDDDVTGMKDLSITGNFLSTGSVNGITTSQFSELGNINSTTVSNIQWEYLGSMDQNISTTDSVIFNGLNMSNQIITSLGTPIGATDAATKDYVDIVSSTGAPPLNSVRLTTITILPNSPNYVTEVLTSTGSPGSLSIDGVLVVVGNRILIKDQVDNRENGVYVVTDDGSSPGSNWVLTRSTDFNQSSMPVLAGSTIFVELIPIASLAGSSWTLNSTVNDVDPLTDAVIWIQTGGSTSNTAGNGIDSTQLLSSIIEIDSTSRFTYPGGQLELNTVTVPFGGTGLTTLTSGNVLIGQGTSIIDVSKVAPSGNFVGTSDSQTLTNKTITSTTNNVISRGLFSNSGSNIVNTFASPGPSGGEHLIATSSTTAEWQTFPSEAFEPGRTLFVYQGALNISPNWDSVQSAITDAISLTPTAINQILVRIYPGTYSEINPLTIPAYVNLSGAGSVIIKPTAPANVGAVINLTGNGRIYGIVIEGADGSGGYTTHGIISSGSGGSIDYLHSVVIQNCTVSAFKISGDGTKFSKILTTNNCSVLVTESSPFIMTNGIEVELGGVLSSTDTVISGFFSGGSVINKGIFIHDTFSYADITNMKISIVNIGIDIGTGVSSNIVGFYPFLSLIVCTIDVFTTIGVSINSKSNINIKNLDISDNTDIYPNQLHVFVTNPSLPADPNQATVGNINLRTDLINIFGGATNNLINLQGSFLSIIPNEEQTIFTGDVGIGIPFLGSLLKVGEGDSHSIGMVIFRDDGGVFTNITQYFTRDIINPYNCDLSTIAAIDLSSAPATIDGISPTSGISRILIKDGSIINPGVDSVDNGIYLWNGVGNPMTRTTDFSNGLLLNTEIYFIIDIGTVNYGSCWKIDSSTISNGIFVVGLNSFGLVKYSDIPLPLIPVNNDALYIGSGALLPFSGIEIQFTKPLLLSSGNVNDFISWEYWDGSSWSNLNIMSTNSEAPYTNYSNNTLSWNVPIISYNSTNYQYRFGSISNWSTTTINTVLGYWVRLRVIDTSIVTQLPVIMSIQLQTNKTQINKEGFVEYFGKARSRKRINISSKTMTTSAYSNPTNRNLKGADNGSINITLDSRDSNLVYYTTIGMSYGTVLPYEIDTSIKVTIKTNFTQSLSGTGNIAYRVDYTFINNTDTIGDSPSGTLYTTGTLTHAVGGSSGQHGTLSTEINITEFNSTTDVFWFQVIRLGTNILDTYNSSIYAYNYVIEYSEWCNGLYIE